MTYGFIITRCVTCEKTNKYWNECIFRIRKYYPSNEIVVIDDNSNMEFVKDVHHIDNVRIINSEFKGAGEILPYYYLHKFRFFPEAVILHDSVFFNTRIKFEVLKNVPVMPLWHFVYNENVGNSLWILRHIKNINIIRRKLQQDSVQTLGFRRQDKWSGCFGVQSYISLSFLDTITRKYDLMSVIPLIKNRNDRCCLERIMGIIFSTEFPTLTTSYSLLGDIWKYQKWGTTYDEYISGKLYQNKPLVKVWTGR